MELRKKRQYTMDVHSDNMEIQPFLTKRMQAAIQKMLTVGRPYWY